MKTIIKATLAACIILLSGCSGDTATAPAPVPVQLSQSAVSLEAGQTVEINISKGTPPFTVSVSDPSVASATISGNKVTITCISAGTAIIRVTGSDKEVASISVTVAAKADATPRFELPGGSIIKNTDAAYLFYSDKGNLFSSTKYKLGYSPRDGKIYYFVEWNRNDGTGVGTKSGASLRTQTGTVTLYSLDVLKYEGGVIWVTYKQTASSSEGRIVQKL